MRKSIKTINSSQKKKKKKSNDLESNTSDEVLSTSNVNILII